MTPPSPEPGAIHQPVLVREVLQFLSLDSGLTVVDGTVGAGGHSRHILKHIGPTGTLIGLDRDPMMLAHAAQVLSAPNVSLHHTSYADLAAVLKELNLSAVDRILLDLGLSSDQLADDARGFSFDSAGPLDLRFDATSGEPAWKLLEQLDERRLADLLERYGEERFGAEIAAELNRRRGAVRSAADLSMAVAAAIPARFRREARKRPATRVFQALRIAVNAELDQLERALTQTLPQCLAPGGRAVVISFHSLEDRMVKTHFRDKARWEILTPKPITATPAEQRINPRSRTARLRAANRR